MAYRPDPSQFDVPLTETQLKERRQQLSRLSPNHVLDAYRRAYEECRMEGDLLPRAAAVQEMVITWKLLRLWKRRRPPSRE